MMQANDLSVIAQAVIDVLREEANRTALHLREGYKAPNEWGVFFGTEEAGFAKLPVILVEPTSKRKELEGVSNRTKNEFYLTLMLLHCKMEVARATVRKECLEQVETLERILQSDLQLGGLVAHSYVTGVQAGQYIAGRGARLYSHRLDWWGMTKTRIQRQGGA